MTKFAEMFDQKIHVELLLQFIHMQGEQESTSVSCTFVFNFGFFGSWLLEFTVFDSASLLAPDEISLTTINVIGYFFGVLIMTWNVRLDCDHKVETL